MNRRDFLTRAAMLAGLIAVDPELLIWTPKSMVVVLAMPHHALEGLAFFDALNQEMAETLFYGRTRSGVVRTHTLPRIITNRSF